MTNLAQTTNRQQIIDMLDILATEHGVNVLYAVEAGGRAWGYSSGNSDFDVRGVFIRARADYLTLDPPKDVIEFHAGDLDIVLWDIFKFLRLERNSNPSAIEWLLSASDNVYINATHILRAHWARLKLEHWWNRQALIHHYRGIATRHYYEHIQGKGEVQHKHYIYVIRPLMMMEWLRRYDELPPTLEVLRLVGLLTWTAESAPFENVWLGQKLRLAIMRPIFAKMSGTETSTAAPDDALNAFIESELTRWQENRPEWDRPSEFEEQTFRLDLNSVLHLLLEYRAPGSPH